MDRKTEDSNMSQLKKDLQSSLIERIDYSKDTTDEELYELIDGMIIADPKVRRLAVSDREQLRKKLFHALRKLDILQELVDDSTVTEIMINGPDTIFIEKSGRLMRYPMQFESREKLEDVIQQIVSGCNRVVNEANPIVDARLEKEHKSNKRNDVDKKYNKICIFKLSFTTKLIDDIIFIDVIFRLFFWS